MCVLGQMVRSSAQACRAAQSRPCRLAGTTRLESRPLQDRLKTPSKQVRQETRSWGEGQAHKEAGEGLRGRTGAWGGLSRWALWVTHLNVRGSHVAAQAKSRRTLLGGG